MVGIVESHGLARRDAALGRGSDRTAPSSPSMPVCSATGRPCALHLGDGRARRRQQRLVDPGELVVRASTPAALAASGEPTDTRRGGHIDRGDEPAAPVPAVSHPPALPHRDQLDRLDRAEVLTGGVVDQPAGVERQTVARKPSRPSSERMKQTSWLSGFSAVRRPSASASARTSALVIPPTGNRHSGQLILSQHGQHVGLVLHGVGAPAQPVRAVGSPSPAGVVTGGHGVEPEERGHARAAGRT